MSQNHWTKLQVTLQNLPSPMLPEVYIKHKQHIIIVHLAMRCVPVSVDAHFGEDQMELGPLLKVKAPRRSDAWVLF